MKKVCQLKETRNLNGSSKCNIPIECETCSWYITENELKEVKKRIEKFICLKHSSFGKISH